MNVKRITGFLFIMLLIAVFVTACGDEDASGESEGSSNGSDGEGEETAETVKIGVLASLTGALEAYGKQTRKGFELGLDYATDGTMEVAGKKIEVVFEDTETDPKVARQKAIGLLEDENVDFLVGSSSSGDTLAVTPLAEEYETIMVVEPAVADSITGSEYNDYIFRTGRNSSQDAVAGAAAIADEGVKIATLAPDSAFGQDGVAAFKEAATDLGAEISHEEYADPAATDFTANIQKIIESEPDYLYVIWAGANTPWNQIADMKVQEQGIQISTGVADIATLPTMEPLVGMAGFTVYHHSLPDNEVNDWLVKEHKERFDGEVPDLFTPGGMSAAISIVEALKNSEGETSADKLIETMEGMSFESPKGTMTFRPEDHQALQSLYAVTLEESDEHDYPIPVLERVLTPEETAPPIKNN
ncbi:amino acid/amide ABC transporter substrate-binding protein, HAAT family [Virgibacillus subterraneus]|uniref:Amino acid/amide ABC transporter substrate-binding protein, HAAT family n=1 Tax=Virgibacillus subterraneus TaxID=621109 RepID=A0A1H9J5S0_9BACI|nr:substrate-binding domain-containing protein [Virgibacillus subterraneus]SEQ82079.1 amino acid/amide ABC transporter substrate-binding protein, HAAT family [Virgibacillus subterraneus]